MIGINFYVNKTQGKVLRSLGFKGHDISNNEGLDASQSTYVSLVVQRFLVEFAVNVDRI